MGFWVNGWTVPLGLGVRSDEILVDLLEKLRVANIVVRIAPLSFRLALNFLRQSTVSCLCRVEATLSRWQIHGCLSASAAVIRFAGFTVSIELIRFFASGVTVSHSGDGYYLFPRFSKNFSRFNIFFYPSFFSIGFHILIDDKYPESRDK